MSFTVPVANHLLILADKEVSSFSKEEKSVYSASNIFIKSSYLVQHIMEPMRLPAELPVIILGNIP